MSLLTVVQRFCKRTNINSPTTVYGSTDPQIIQIMALLEEEGADLSGRGSWQRLVHEETYTTTASESQGAIDSIATNNFRYIVSDTFFDRTDSLPVEVINGSDWQAVKAMAVNGPRYSVRIRSGNLICNPVPAAGHTWAFEYVSWNWILDTDGSTEKQYFTADTDTFLLPEPLLLMGLRWRWKKEKGLDYEEDFNTYEKAVADALGREGINKRLSMGMEKQDAKPGIVVSQGSWSL